jgi:hypothetical protein
MAFLAYTIVRYFDVIHMIRKKKFSKLILWKVYQSFSLCFGQILFRLIWIKFWIKNSHSIKVLQIVSWDTNWFELHFQFNQIFHSKLF